MHYFGCPIHLTHWKPKHLKESLADTERKYKSHVLGLSQITGHRCTEATVVISQPQCCPWAKSLSFIYQFVYFICMLSNLLAYFSFFLSLLQKPPKKKSRASGDSRNGKTREIYLRHEPALKNYSEACNRDWFWSADLPHPVWKKYWQSILHWLKIIATVPLPCSNLPLDHSRQGHRVHYTDRSEGGNAGRLMKDLLSRG